MAVFAAGDAVKRLLINIRHSLELIKEVFLKHGLEAINLVVVGWSIITEEVEIHHQLLFKLNNQRLALLAGDLLAIHGWEFLLEQVLVGLLEPVYHVFKDQAGLGENVAVEGHGSLLHRFRTNYLHHPTENVAGILDSLELLEWYNCTRVDNDIIDDLNFANHGGDIAEVFEVKSNQPIVCLGDGVNISIELGEELQEGKRPPLVLKINEFVGLHYHILL